MNKIPAPLTKVLKPFRDLHLSELRDLIRQLRSEHGSAVAGELFVTLQNSAHPFPKRRIDDLDYKKGLLTFIVDLGSATEQALFELLNTLAAAGAVTIHVGGAASAQNKTWWKFW